MHAFLAAAIAAAQPLTPTAEPQPAPAPSIAHVPSQATPSPACCVLAKLTPVFLTLDEPIESDKARIGQSFTITLSEPLAIADGRVVPAGTKGVGEVVHAAKSRAMGKAGELVLAARSFNWNGTRIPLRSLKFGKGQGQDNSGTAAVVGMVVSAWITPFITGGEVRIPAGSDAWAKVAADVLLTPPAPAPAAQPALVGQAAEPPTTITQGGE